MTRQTEKQSSERAQAMNDDRTIKGSKDQKTDEPKVLQNDRSIKEILSDDIDRRLAENPPPKPGLEEFKKMVYERMEQKETSEEFITEEETRTARTHAGQEILNLADHAGQEASNPETHAGQEVFTKKPRSSRTVMLRRLGAIAAIIAVIFIAAIAFKEYIPDVGADKNPKEEILTEDGIVIEDGGWGSSEGEDNVWVITDWNHLAAAKEIYSDLLIPEYIPEGYEFDKLTIETLETGAFTCEYVFIGENDVLEIDVRATESSVNSIEVSDAYCEIETTKGTVFIQDNTNKTATIQMDDGSLIMIWYMISDDEIVKVIENLKN